MGGGCADSSGHQAGRTRTDGQMDRQTKGLCVAADCGGWGRGLQILSTEIQHTSRKMQKSWVSRSGPRTFLASASPQATLPRLAITMTLTLNRLLIFLGLALFI